MHIEGANRLVLVIHDHQRVDLVVFHDFQRLGIQLISMTGNPESPLAKAAEVNLDARVAQEACPLNLAPTSSTTVSLVIGDALAIALLEARGFTAEDFAFSHPGGALGRRLLLKVENVMHAGARLPLVSRGTSLRDALLEMTRKGLGMTVIIEADGKLAGIFTDGDLRRLIESGSDLRSVRAADIMHPQPRTITASALAAQAAELMETHRINSLLVVNSAGELCGAVNNHDLMRAKVI